RGKVQGVGGAVVCSASPERDRPKLINDDRVSVGPYQCADELSLGVKGIDRPRVCIVRDQQRAAQASEIPRSHSHAPWLVQRKALREVADERSVFLIGINKASRPSVIRRKRHVNGAADVLNSKRGKIGRDRGIGGKSAFQSKRSVVNLDPVIGVVDRK